MTELALLEDSRFLMDLIGRITGETPQQVQERWAREHRRVGSNVGEAVDRCGLTPHVWSPQMEEFYARTDAFLYESTVWNRTPVKNRMRRWIADFLARDLGRGAKVLMFGDGLGFDSAYLALAGYDVTYWEPGKDDQTFARAIFAKSGARVRVLAAAAEIAGEKFDAVLCLDVLEHVPDPPSLVGMLAGALRPGGRLIAHAPFYFLSDQTKTHLLSNRRFSGNLSRLYRPHGLRLIDGRFLWDPIVLEKAAGRGHRTRRSWANVVALGLGGCLLAIGRYWSLPHTCIASLLCRVDPRAAEAAAGKDREIAAGS
jgi:SAM-dependent methyltransferase